MIKKVLVLIFILFNTLPVLAKEIFVDDIYSYDIPNGITFDKIKKEIDYKLILTSKVITQRYEISVTQNINTLSLRIWSIDSYKNDNTYIFKDDYISDIQQRIRFNREIIGNLIMQNYTKCKPASYGVGCLYCTTP